VERFAADCGFSLSQSRFAGRFGTGEVAALDAGAIGASVAVLAPQTFMNRSGRSVAEALAGLHVDDPGEDLVVVFDDVDLPLGRLRIRPRGSSGGHRGLASVIDCIGTENFPRLRFGVGRPGDATATTVDWVLQDFSESEESALNPVVASAAEALATLAAFGVTPAMNRYNRALDFPDPPGAEGDPNSVDSKDDRAT
jgi:PTH1 family peptidyl-tRNA hydrolase